MTRALHAVRKHRGLHLSGTRFVVYGAIVANFAIALTKFVAAGMTGSSAMLSEGIHPIALRLFLAANRGSPFWRSLQSSKDPLRTRYLLKTPPRSAGWQWQPSAYT